MKMSEIAQLAKVSKATVSRVINSPEKVSDKLRKRVEKVLNETNYTPNLLAQELVTKKTNVIGVLLPQIGTDIFSKLTEGAMDALGEYGYHILLGNIRQSGEQLHKYIDIFKKKHVDGIIYFPTSLIEDPVQLLKDIEMPIITVGQPQGEFDEASVTFKEYEASKEMVQHLIDKGHKRIGYIGILDNEKVSKGSNQRFEGYKSAIEQNGLKLETKLLAKGEFDIPSGYVAMKKIMADNRMMPTAVFTATDRLAFGAIQCLKENAYLIPKDIVVTGIDDMDIASVFTPKLTTIKFDYYDAGFRAGKLMIDAIENHQGLKKQINIDYEIILRESTDY